MSLAPIALFVYNRAQHARRTVESLKLNDQANSSDLFIFSDAARESKARAAVDEVRRYIRTVRGFKSVHLVEQSDNLGLAKSVMSGLTRICGEFDRVIVLEDDLVVSRHFLEFMNTALKRYEDDDSVMQIAGYMFPVVLTSIMEDALFLPFISSWGWGTWSRAWRHFDEHASGYRSLQFNDSLRRKFDLDGHYRYFKMLQARLSGKADSWAILWYLSVFMRQGLTLYPKKTLVLNQGFDGSGVNCATSAIRQDALDANFRVTKWVDSIEVSPMAGHVMRNLPRPRPRLKSVTARLFGR